MKRRTSSHNGDIGITRERIAFLPRLYHSSIYAGEATGIAPASLQRAAKRFGMKFRHVKASPAGRQMHGLDAGEAWLPAQSKKIVAGKFQAGDCGPDVAEL